MELQCTYAGSPYQNQNQPLQQAITAPEVPEEAAKRTCRQRIGIGDQLMNISWNRSPARSLGIHGEELTSASGDETTSDLRKRRHRYQDMCQSVHLEQVLRAYLAECMKIQPPIAEYKYITYRVDVKCIFKSDAPENNQYDSKSPGELMRSQTHLLNAKQVHWCLPKQVQTRPKMISECAG